MGAGIIQHHDYLFGYITNEHIDWTQSQALLNIHIDNIPDLSSLYALLGHDHDEDYAAIAHNHDLVYSLTTHNHDLDYAALIHSHDLAYAAIGHDHDEDYAVIAHNHDLEYADIAHDHDLVYSLTTHDHDLEYADIAHDHSGVYLEAETDPVVGAIDGIVKANGAGVISAATAGSDFFNASSDVDHDSTTNYEANQHIDWTNASSNLATSGTGSFEQIGAGRAVIAGYPLVAQASVDGQGVLNYSEDGTKNCSWYTLNTGAVTIISTHGSLSLTGSTSLSLSAANGTASLSSANDAVLLTTGANAAMYFRAGGLINFQDVDAANADRVVINTATGYMGLGTASPAKRLHVAGNTTGDYARIDTALDLNVVVRATTAPTVALAGAAGNVDVGDHRYAITYVTPIGDTEIYVGSISNTVTCTAGNQQVNLTGIPVSPDARVTARNIYRTIASSPLYHFKLLYTINDNVTTTYTDNTADAGLTGGAVSPGYYYKDNKTHSYIHDTGLNQRLAWFGMKNTSLGRSAGAALTDLAFGNTLCGNRAGLILSSGANNTIVGDGAGTALTTGTGCAFFGAVAGGLTTGANNAFFGAYTGYTATVGTLNTAFGSYSYGHSDYATAYTGTGNTTIGYSAGWGVMVSGAYNTMLGTYTGNATNTSNNLFLGAYAGKYETGASRLIIDTLDRTNEAGQRLKALIYGEFNATVASQILTFNSGLVNLPYDNQKLTFGVAGATDSYIQWNGAALDIYANGFVDIAGPLSITPGSSVTPANNGDVAFELTSDTIVKIKAKGSDASVREVSLPITNDVLVEYEIVDSTYDIDWNASQVYKLTLNEDAAITLSFTDPTLPVARLVLILIQDADGGETLVWPAGIYWAGGAEPVLSAGAGARDVVALFWDGTNYYASAYDYATI